MSNQSEQQSSLRTALTGENDRRNPGFFESADNEKSEFKLFRVIEATIAGVFSFVEGLLITYWTLVRRPRSIIEFLDRAEQPRFSRPFTFLAVNAVIGTLLFQEMFLQLSPTLEGTASSLTELYGQLTVRHFFVLSLPVILIVVAFGVVLSLAIARNDFVKRRQVLYLFCYSIGFEFFVLTVAGTLFIVTEDTQADSGLFFYIPAALYAYVAPLIVLLAGLGRLTGRLSIATVLLPVVLVGGVIAAVWCLTLYRTEREGRRRVTSGLECSKLLPTIASGHVALGLSNHTKNALFITRGGWEISDVQVKVTRWEAGDDPILTLSPGEGRWVELETGAGSAIQTRFPLWIGTLTGRELCWIEGDE